MVKIKAKMLQCNYILAFLRSDISDYKISFCKKPIKILKTITKISDSSEYVCKLVP